MNMTTRKRLTAGAIALLGLGSAFVGASPAQAHAGGRCLYLPDNRGFGCVLEGHVRAYAHDSRADNWGVRIHLWTTTPGTKYVVGDGNGSARGDGWKNAASGERFTSFKVCAGENGVDTVCTVTDAA